MSADEYTFASSNMGDITIRVDGRWKDGRENGADLTVWISGTGEEREFDEVYYGSADEIFGWLVDRGVEFSSPRSFYFNLMYVEEVMIDRSMSEAQALDRIAGLSDERVALGVARCCFDPAFAPRPASAVDRALEREAKAEGKSMGACAR